MEMQVKIRILLLSLYNHKYNGRYYDVSEPFSKNNLPLSNLEATEMTHLLEKDGLIKVISVGEGHFAQITADGVELLEENNFYCDSTYVPRDRINPLEKELLQERLEELAEILSQPKYRFYVVKEELPKEIEELKRLVHILGRRSWKQMLKGKLLELSQDHMPADMLSELTALFDVQFYAEATSLSLAKNLDLISNSS